MPAQTRKELKQVAEVAIDEERKQRIRDSLAVATIKGTILAQLGKPTDLHHIEVKRLNLVRARVNVWRNLNKNDFT